MVTVAFGREVAARRAAAEAFLQCVRKMRSDLSLWNAHTKEFSSQVRNTTLVIVGGGNRQQVAVKLFTVAGIIAAMHGSSVGRRGRMLACDALTMLDTFSIASCKRRAVNAYRLGEILAQDARDRGVRGYARTATETIADAYA